MSELKEKATKGIFWSAAEQLSVQGLQFVFGLVIARILAPEEYGLIAMLLIFTAIAQSFVDSGFSSALIQKINRTQTDFSTVFYFNLLIAISAYLILYITAPYIAEFYHQPQLVLITRVISLSLIINALGAIQRTIYTINFNFKIIAIASLGAALISGIVGVIMANLGYGVWALVGVAIVGNITTTILFWSFSKWKPTPEFSWQSFKSLFAFGSNILLSGIIRTIYDNIYTLVIGRKYNATDVGYFNRSQSLAIIFTTYIVMVLQKVSFPAMCAVQTDNERLSTMFNKLVNAACYIVFPLATAIVVLAEPLIELVLTAKWLPSAPLLQILSLGYVLAPFRMMNLIVLNATGRSDYFLRSEIVKKILAVGILFATLPFGLYWLCWGVVLYGVTEAVVSIIYAKKVVNTGFLTQFRGASKILIASLFMGVIIYFVSTLFSSLWLKIFIGGISGVIAYALATFSLRINEYKLFLEMARK